jgi:hypothetical protein
VTPIYQQLTAGWPRYHQPQPPQEAPVSLADDVKQVTGFLESHILGRAAELEANPVVQELEAAALGPQFEQVIAGLVKDLAAMFAQAPAAPQPADGEPAQVPG